MCLKFKWSVVHFATDTCNKQSANSTRSEPDAKTEFAFLPAQCQCDLRTRSRPVKLADYWGGFRALINRWSDIREVWNWYQQRKLRRGHHHKKKYKKKGYKKISPRQRPRKRQSSRLLTRTVGRTTQTQDNVINPQPKLNNLPQNVLFIRKTLHQRHTSAQRWPFSLTRTIFWFSSSCESIKPTGVV